MYKRQGSDTAAVSEAIGRLISYLLRLASPVSPRDRLKEMVNQLSGIGGGRPLGFGPQRVLSLPDGVAQVLDDFLNRSAEEPETVYTNGNGNGSPVLLQPDAAHATLTARTVGDLCPECGNSSVINEEGCRKCNSCGYSEC